MLENVAFSKNPPFCSVTPVFYKLLLRTRSDPRRHDMRILPILSQAAQLGLLLVSVVPVTALSATVAVVDHQASEDGRIGTALKEVGNGDDFPQPSTQPFSTTGPIIVNGRPSPNSTTTSISQTYTICLRQLHSILGAPETIEYAHRTLERALQVLAAALFDYDLLYDQDLAVHIGDFTLQFQDVAEHLSVLAVKAVIMKLVQLLQKGLLGYFEGELIEGHAEVRMIFAFGVIGGALGDWEMRKRNVGEGGRTSLGSG
ncbi:hypothetical protein BDR22DRAFT_820898 [Usnea florida]